MRRRKRSPQKLTFPEETGEEETGTEAPLETIETLVTTVAEGEIVEIDILDEVAALGEVEASETTEEMTEKSSEIQNLMKVMTETAEETKETIETDIMKGRERDQDQEDSPQRRPNLGGRRELLLRIRTSQNRYMKYIMLHMMII